MRTTLALVTCLATVVYVCAASMQQSDMLAGGVAFGETAACCPTGQTDADGRDLLVSLPSSPTSHPGAPLQGGPAGSGEEQSDETRCLSSCLNICCGKCNPSLSPEGGYSIAGDGLFIPLVTDVQMTGLTLSLVDIDPPQL